MNLTSLELKQVCLLFFRATAGYVNGFGRYCKEAKIDPDDVPQLRRRCAEIAGLPATPIIKDVAALDKTLEEFKTE
jgi:hypothetical protein